VSAGEVANTLVVAWNTNRQNTFTRSNTESVYLCSDPSVQYDRLIQNSDGSYRYLRKNQSRLEFDSSGRLSQDINAQGQAINITRSASYNNRPIQLTEAISGKSLTLQYASARGPVSSVSDSLGRKVELTESTTSIGRELSEVAKTDSNGSVVWSMTYTYDPAGRVLSGVDKEGNPIFTDVYGSDGQMASQKDGVSTHPATRYAYDETQEAGVRRVTITDRIGKTLVYRYDTQYNLLSRQDQNGKIQSATYDNHGNPLTAKDQDGNLYSYNYDSGGNQTLATDPAGNKVTRSYDSLNRLTSVSDPSKAVTTYSYDGNNNLVKKTDAFNKVTSWGYNSDSLLQSQTLPNGGVETYSYTNGLRTGKKDAAGNLWRYGYDLVGRLVSRTDPIGQVSTMGYDGLDHMVSLTDPLKETQSASCNSEGWKLSQTDALGNKTTYGYDGNGNRLTQVDPSPAGGTFQDHFEEVVAHGN
jgi:YD repeat-containing protein